VNRILHIFRKDAIRLWPQASVFLALLATNAWADRKFPNAVHDGPFPLLLLAVLLPIACSVLLIALIHQERLVGDRQYWLSRPIPRRELVGAKILFIVVFVNLPLLLSQGAVVVAAGLPLFSNWSNFLSMQLFFTAADILPVAALAAVSKNMAPAVFVFLATVGWMTGLAALLWPGEIAFRLASDTSLVWIEVTLAAAALAAGSIAVLLLQYSRRGAMLSRALLAGTLVLAACSLLLPHSAKWAIQMKFSPQRVDPKDFRISAGYGGGRMREQTRSTTDDTAVSLEFSIQIHQPLGISLHAEGFRPIAEAPSGDSWRPAWAGAFVQSVKGVSSLRVDVDREFYNRGKDTPVHFYGTIDFTVLSDGQVIPVPGRRGVNVPDIGWCIGPPEDSGQVSCDATLPKARLLPVVAGEPSGGDSSAVLAPYPYSAGYSPLQSLAFSVSNEFFVHPDEVRLLVQKPIAYIQRSFDFGNIMLADYEVGHP
jgi:hypothetical protein